MAEVERNGSAGFEGIPVGTEEDLSAAQEERAVASTFLPVGTVLRLKDGERNVIVAGVMACDGSTGRYWDYVGWPYPDGRRDGTDYFFDRDMIQVVLQLGFVDITAMGFREYLDTLYDEYRKKRLQQAVQSA